MLVAGEGRGFTACKWAGLILGTQSDIEGAETQDGLLHFSNLSNCSRKKQ